MAGRGKGRGIREVEGKNILMGPDQSTPRRRTVNTSLVEFESEETVFDNREDTPDEYQRIKKGRGWVKLQRVNMSELKCFQTQVMKIDDLSVVPMDSIIKFNKDFNNFFTQER